MHDLAQHPDVKAAGFTAPELANFLAAKAVSHATAFLEGRHLAPELASNAHSLQLELMTAFTGAADIHVNAILDPSRMLVFAMMRTADAEGVPARQDRWADVMAAMVDLVRLESGELRKSGAQRS